MKMEPKMIVKNAIIPVSHVQTLNNVFNVTHMIKEY